MNKQPESIVDNYHERRSQREPVLNSMEKFAEMYNGELVLPLPEIDGLEKPAVANLLAQGLDATAQRVASVMPTLSYWPMRDGVRSSENRADMRRRVNQEWWSFNRMSIKLRRRARFLIGYGMSPVVVLPDFKNKLPMWRIINPLVAFPSPSDEIDCITPSDVIVSMRRSLSWIKASYPDQYNRLYRGTSMTNRPDSMYTLLDYIDEDERVLIVIGADRIDDPNDLYSERPSAGITPFEVLERIPNRAGMCPVVFPKRIELDRTQGQFDQLLGVYQMQAALTALNYISVKRGVFPDVVALGKPGTIPKVYRQPSGLQGEMGMVQADAVQVLNQEPSMQTGPMIDRLERAMRIGGSLPAEMSGESASNIRTARRGEAVLSAAIDFSNQEYQEIIADSLEAENVRAIAITKGYWGAKSLSLYTSKSGDKSGPTFIPNEVFETDMHAVKYSFPGTDMNGLVISMGQRVGIGEMSIETAMESDPMIEDPIREKNRVHAEALGKALLGGIQQQAAQGQIPPSDVAAIMRLVEQNKMSLADAVDKVHQAAQARQAQQAPPGAPATQPGIAQPGAGAQASPMGPGAGGPRPFAQLLQALRSPAAQSPAEQTVGAPPNG